VADEVKPGLMSLTDLMGLKERWIGVMIAAPVNGLFNGWW
jgi:hypothetical protein